MTFLDKLTIGDLILIPIFIFNIVFFIAIYLSNKKQQRSYNQWLYGNMKMQNPGIDIVPPPNSGVLDIPFKKRKKGEVYSPRNDFENQMRGNVIDMFD